MPASFRIVCFAARSPACDSMARRARGWKTCARPTGRRTDPRWRSFDLGQKDQIEYPIGKVLHTADGYLSDVRVSPDGERVAFFEHPIRYDDRGWLKVVDKAGMVKTLTPEYWGAEGVAWTRDGKAVVYAAGDKGWDSFYPRVASVDGTAKANFSVSGIGIFLLDVSPRGTWLVISN